MDAHSAFLLAVLVLESAGDVLIQVASEMRCVPVELGHWLVNKREVQRSEHAAAAPSNCQATDTAGARKWLSPRKQGGWPLRADSGEGAGVRDLGRKTLPVGWKATYLPLMRQPMASAGRFSCDASTSCPPLGESTAESFDECNLKFETRIQIEEKPIHPIHVIAVSLLDSDE